MYDPIEIFMKFFKWIILVFRIIFPIHHLLFFFFLPLLFFFGLGEFPTDDSEVEPLPMPIALTLMPPPPPPRSFVLVSSSNFTFRLVVIFFLDLSSSPYAPLLHSLKSLSESLSVV